MTRVPVDRMRMDPRMARRDFPLEQPMTRVPVDRRAPAHVPMEPVESMGRGVEKTQRRRPGGVGCDAGPRRTRARLRDGARTRARDAGAGVGASPTDDVDADADVSAMQMPMQMSMQMQIPGQIPGQIPVQMSMPMPMQMPMQMPVQMPVQIPMQGPVSSSMPIPMTPQQSGTSPLKKKATVNANAKPFIPAFARKSTSL